MPAITSSHEAEPFVLNSSRYYDILSNLWTKVIEPVSHRWEPPKLLAKRQTCYITKFKAEQKSKKSPFLPLDYFPQDLYCF